MESQFGIERLAPEQFDYICRFIYEETGIVLNDKKVEMVHRRLTKLMKSRGFNSLSSYFEYFVEHAEREQHELINALTTNLTRFFREPHHFDFLKDNYLPWLFSKKNDNKRIRIWSSACSTGEEPYSIAMILRHHFGQYLREWDVKILATDIDTQVLHKAKTGIYQKSSIDDIPMSMRSTCLQKKDNEVHMAECIKDLITFKQLNLLHQWPMRGPFDVIFCRNVIIYFDKPTQQHLFTRFHQYLEPKGLLILGHSESLGASASKFKAVGKTIFGRTSGGDSNAP